MKAFEIRTKDLKTIVCRMFETESEREAVQYFKSRGFNDEVLVVNEFETDAEADKARLDWIESNPGRFVSELSLGVSNSKNVRSVIDADRQSPQPTVRVIATPEGQQ